MTRGFFVPAFHSLPSLGAADVATRPATASAEAEHVSGTTASLPGGDDSAASSGPGNSLGLTAFQEFVERRKSAAHRVVLDLRPGEEFRRWHLKGSTSIPIDQLAPRLLELPPPFGQPVSIVGNEEVRAAAGELRGILLLLYAAEINYRDKYLTIVFASPSHVTLSNTSTTTSDITFGLGTQH